MELMYLFTQMIMNVTIFGETKFNNMPKLPKELNWSKIAMSTFQELSFLTLKNSTNSKKFAQKISKNSKVSSTFQQVFIKKSSISASRDFSNFLIGNKKHDI